MTIADYALFLERTNQDHVLGPQYCLQLFTLARGIRAEEILEIGLGWGHSGRAFCAAMSSVHGSGALTSVDMYQHDRSGFDEFAENCGVRWNRVVSLSQDYTHDGPVDLLYIDESPGSNANDFRRFYDNVRPGGLIVMDGIGNPPWDKQPDATICVNELASVGHPIVHLPYSEEYCHAVYRKPL